MNPNEESVQWRLELAVAAARMIEAHPIGGIGLGQFKRECVRYNPQLPRHWIAHDSYLQIAAESGIPTCAVFLVIMAIAFANCRVTQRLSLNTALGELGDAVGIALSGFAVGALFITAWFAIPYWILAFMSQNLREIAVQVAGTGSSGVGPQSVTGKPQRRILPKAVA